MNHNHKNHIAKQLLEQSEQVIPREEAIKEAMGLGMPLHEIEEYLDWLDKHAPSNREYHKPPTKLYLLIVFAVSIFCSQADAAKRRETTATNFDFQQRTLEADISLTVDGEEVERTTLSRNAVVTYEAAIGRRSKMQSLGMKALPFGYSQGNYTWNNISPRIDDPQDVLVVLSLIMPDLKYTISVKNEFGQFHSVFDQSVELESLLDITSLDVEKMVRERNQIDSNGHRDFWHFYNIEGPTLSGPVELYHSMLGGKEVILTLEEFGYLPVENLTLVSTRTGRRNAAIPEPSTLVIMIVAVGMVLLVRKGNQQ